MLRRGGIRFLPAFYLEVGMKWAVLVLAGAIMVAGMVYHRARQIRADQGYVRSDDGQEWRMTRMQTLGLGEDYVAVYRQVK